MDQLILNNNYYEYGDFAICGTRGWFYEEERSGELDEKVFKRELLRLEASLKAAGDREKLVFLHYPPRYKGYECPEILALLQAYGVGVEGMVENILGCPLFNHTPCVHNYNLVCHFRNHAKIVGDEHNGASLLLLEIL